MSICFVDAHSARSDTRELLFLMAGVFPTAFVSPNRLVTKFTQEERWCVWRITNAYEVFASRQGTAIRPLQSKINEPTWSFFGGCVDSFALDKTYPRLHIMEARLEI